MTIDYEWNRQKSRTNLEKHGVDFSDAVAALEDDLALTIPDPDTDHEERFVTMGTDMRGRLLVVAFTWRQDRIRLISARNATPRERRQYLNR